MICLCRHKWEVKLQLQPIRKQALEGRGWPAPHSGRFLPGKDPLHRPAPRQTGSASGPVWMGPQNLTTTRIRPSDRSARSVSLYRLRYPQPPQLPHRKCTCARVTYQQLSIRGARFMTDIKHETVSLKILTIRPSFLFNISVALPSPRVSLNNNPALLANTALSTTQ
jgi:hypothetical protein